ncbi:hypothetical protein LT493_29335 [Streptomyces tricolor]|nr:hypothetical protein [Streptomyces tricolor]
MAGGHVPSLLELMDRTTVKAVNALARMGTAPRPPRPCCWPPSTPRTPPPTWPPSAPCARRPAPPRSCPAEDAAESELLLQARRLSLTALEAVKGTTMIDDVCVPRSRLGEMLEGVERIAAAYDLTIGVCAHAGDGNTHPTVCFDARDPDESRRARESFDEIMALGLELGGTITGEHGVGVLKKEWLAREIGPVGVEMQRAVKQVFDPLGILNPGKLF